MTDSELVPDARKVHLLSTIALVRNLCFDARQIAEVDVDTPRARDRFSDRAALFELQLHEYERSIESFWASHPVEFELSKKMLAGNAQLRALASRRELWTGRYPYLDAESVTVLRSYVKLLSGNVAHSFVDELGTESRQRSATTLRRVLSWVESSLSQAEGRIGTSGD